jgi:hypothetical protein
MLLLAISGVVIAFGLLMFAVLSDSKISKAEWDRQDLKRKEMELHIQSFERKNKGVSR